MMVKILSGVMEDNNDLVLSLVISIALLLFSIRDASRDVYKRQGPKRLVSLLELA